MSSNSESQLTCHTIDMEQKHSYHTIDMEPKQEPEAQPTITSLERVQLRAEAKKAKDAMDKRIGWATVIALLCGGAACGYWGVFADCDGFIARYMVSLYNWTWLKMLWGLLFPRPSVTYKVKPWEGWRSLWSSIELTETRVHDTGTLIEEGEKMGC